MYRLFALALAASCLLPAQSGTKKALLIAAWDYDPALRLESPKSAVGRLSTPLVRMGFHVTPLENPNRKQLIDGLKHFAASLLPGDTALLYFDGHGLTLNGDTFLLPIDYPSKPDTDVPDHALSLTDRFLRGTDRPGIKRIVIFNACRTQVESTLKQTPGYRAYTAGDVNGAYQFLAPAEPGKPLTDSPQFLNDLADVFALSPDIDAAIESLRAKWRQALPAQRGYDFVTPTTAPSTRHSGFGLLSRLPGSPGPTARVYVPPFAEFIKDPDGRSRRVVYPRLSESADWRVACKTALEDLGLQVAPYRGQSLLVTSIHPRIFCMDSADILYAQRLREMRVTSAQLQAVPLTPVNVRGVFAYLKALDQITDEDSCAPLTESSDTSPQDLKFLLSLMRTAEEFPASQKKFDEWLKNPKTHFPCGAYLNLVVPGLMGEAEYVNLVAPRLLALFPDDAAEVFLTSWLLAESTESADAWISAGSKSNETLAAASRTLCKKLKHAPDSNICDAAASILYGITQQSDYDSMLDSAPADIKTQIVRGIRLSMSIYNSSSTFPVDSDNIEVRLRGAGGEDFAGLPARREDYAFYLRVADGSLGALKTLSRALLDRGALELAAAFSGMALRKATSNFRLPEERSVFAFGAKPSSDLIDLKLLHFRAAIHLGLPELALEGVEQLIQDPKLRDALRCEALLRVRLSEEGLLDGDNLDVCARAEREETAVPPGGVIDRLEKVRRQRLKGLRSAIEGKDEEALKSLEESHTDGYRYKFVFTRATNWEIGEFYYYRSLIHTRRGEIEKAKFAHDQARDLGWWKWDVTLPAPGKPQPAK